MYGHIGEEGGDQARLQVVAVDTPAEIGQAGSCHAQHAADEHPVAEGETQEGHEAVSVCQGTVEVEHGEKAYFACFEGYGLVHRHSLCRFRFL